MLERWLDDPLDSGGATLRDALRRHGSSVQGTTGERAGYSRLRIPLPHPARRQISGEMAAPAALPPRPEFYDFEILARQAERAGPLLERSLGALNYVVFDTETTGLDPNRDRIIQIAGVRIVNRRLLSGEVFEALVNPGQPIKQGSIRFHGITDAMVAGRPPIEVVLPLFHRFAHDAVLVAHNAAFDMAFLRRAESDAGVTFDQPVLELAFALGRAARSRAGPRPRYHRGTLRHHAARSASGAWRCHGHGRDLLRMLDLLEARGIATLGAALAASEQATALRRRQRAQFGPDAGTQEGRKPAQSTP